MSLKQIRNARKVGRLLRRRRLRRNGYSVTVRPLPIPSMVHITLECIDYRPTLEQMRERGLESGRRMLEQFSREDIRQQAEHMVANNGLPRDLAWAQGVLDAIREADQK